MLIKNALLVLLLTIATLGCDLSRLVNAGRSGNSNAVTPSPTATPKPSPTSTLYPEATPAKPSYLVTLKRSAGKYPEQIKLLEISELRDRLKKLLGKEFAPMKANWNVESPIEIENDIFMASGCEQHNCGDNHYLLFVDLKNDNINIFHIESDGTKHYFESGEIKLPANFAAEVGTDN